ncbi:high mobility group box domain-containing protein, partial [Infundibulicybe gibba]
KKPGHVRRPRNAFIFFRSNFYEEQKLYSTEIDQNDISRRAGQRWKSLSDEEKEPFRLLAENEKIQHQAMFPDY